MAFKIVITHKAHIDTLEGIEWYCKQSAGVGNFIRPYERNTKHFAKTHTSKSVTKTYVTCL